MRTEYTLEQLIDKYRYKITVDRSTIPPTIKWNKNLASKLISQSSVETECFKK